MKEHSRGFITIATGSEHYYMLARNLLRSCRCHSREQIPFALLCDRENAYTEEFDQVILMEQPSNSYLDKLAISRYSPYEETIFIDADSLILRDPAGLWEDFQDAAAVSCYGTAYPPGSGRGWFRHENTGRWKDQITFEVGLHGGIYYFRQSELARNVFETAIALTGEYSQYQFRDFDKPADEPVIALSMAIHGCIPVEKNGPLLFAHSCYRRLSSDRDGSLLVDGKISEAIVCHFATKNTHGYLYTYMSRTVNLRVQNPVDPGEPDPREIRRKTWKHDLKTWCRYTVRRILGPIIPIADLRRMTRR